MQPITNPPVPYMGPIRGGFTPGTMFRIQGNAPPTADKFNINLHCGAPPSDVALHVSVRLLQNYIARNSMQNGDWGTEEDSGSLTIAPGQNFEVLVLCDPGSYKIAINGNHFCEFRHRIPFQQVTHLAVDGDVSLSLIVFEGGASAPAPPPPMTGGPDYAPNYGPPPGQYGPPQGPYGPSPYGPPKPPGHQEESGFDNFLETAGTLIAGAIASGAAHNLLSGLSGGGAGGQAQQQHYQPPPPPPPPPQQPMFPFGGQGSAGGLGSVGSLLENFAGQILSPRKYHVPLSAPKSVTLSNQPPPVNMPMPSSAPLPPPPYMPPLPSAAPMYVPPPPPAQLPPYCAPPAYVPPPMYSAPPSTCPIQPPAYPVQPPAYPVEPPPYPIALFKYPTPSIGMQAYGRQPIYPQKKMKKSKVKTALKYGAPVAAAGVGACAISHAINHSSSSSSSSDSD